MLAVDVGFWNITHWAGAISLELRVVLRQRRQVRSKQCVGGHPEQRPGVTSSQPEPFRRIVSPSRGPFGVSSFDPSSSSSLHRHAEPRGSHRSLPRLRVFGQALQYGG
jgi:hypothetical protein